MIVFILSALCSISDEFVYKPVVPIKPGDDLVLYLKLRSQLYLSMDSGVVVLNNSFFNENDIDVKIPISIRKVDNKYTDGDNLYYSILIDSSEICSHGYLYDVLECNYKVGGDPNFIFNGNEDDFTIEGRGGCLTMYNPGKWTTTYKHGIRIDSCRGEETQRFMIKRGEI